MDIQTRKIERIRHLSFAACGNTENADFNAAKIIAFRAVINLPIVFCLGN